MIDSIIITIYMISTTLVIIHMYTLHIKGIKRDIDQMGLIKQLYERNNKNDSKK